MTGPREEAFGVDRLGRLVRSVTPRRGSPYEHRCDLSALEAVAHRFDESSNGLNIETICAAEDLPVTQVATAIAFLLERGIVQRVGRAAFAASACVHLDAMTEYHALRG